MKYWWCWIIHLIDTQILKSIKNYPTIKASGKNPPKNLNQARRSTKANAKLARKGFNTVWKTRNRRSCGWGPKHAQQLPRQHIWQSVLQLLHKWNMDESHGKRGYFKIATKKCHSTQDVTGNKTNLTWPSPQAHYCWKNELQQKKNIMFLII